MDSNGEAKEKQRTEGQGNAMEGRSNAPWREATKTVQGEGGAWRWGARQTGGGKPPPQFYEICLQEQYFWI